MLPFNLAHLDTLWNQQISLYNLLVVGFCSMAGIVSLFAGGCAILIARCSPSDAEKTPSSLPPKVVQPES